MKLFFVRIIEFYLLLYYKLSLFKSKQFGQKTEIIYVNTHDKGGGAAKVALQLFEKQVGSALFVGKKTTSNHNVFEIDSELWNRVGLFFRKIEQHYSLLDFSKIGWINILKFNSFKSSSIVHLHNIHGYFLSPVLLKILFKSKKVIWTLHDDFLLTGHCSSSMNCDKWKINCGSCPNLDIYPKIEKDSTHFLSNYKESILKEINPIIVTPSMWLERKVRLKFPFLHKVITIHNGVDTNVFFPLPDKKSIRLKYTIPEDRIVLLFVAELSTNNPFKGGSIIRELVLNSLPEKVVLITIGDKNVEVVNSNHFTFPYISEDQKLNELYNLADIMLYPTQADNLPLVVLESMACGVPVIASNIGGISEIINEKNDGFLVNNYSSSDNFLASINQYIQLNYEDKKRLSINARENVLKNFSIEKMNDQYTKLYNSVLENLNSINFE
jgi:glycosyltransferase involved in cell wall biosynthesis